MPAAPSPFVDHCAELLAPHGRLRVRRMFGGHGIDIDGLFVAIVVGDRLFLKTVEATRGAFDAAGCDAFGFIQRGRAVTTSYRAPPAEALDSPHAMAPWARLAIAAAVAARGAAAVKRAPAAASPTASPSARRAKPTAAGRGDRRR